MSQPNADHTGTPSFEPAAPASATDTVELSEAWKKRFAQMERAGGLKMTKFKELSFSERMNCTFNGWAAIFGIFYYISKGMWKRGLVYWVMTFVGLLLLALIATLAGLDDMLSGVHFGGAWAGVYGAMANRDYYKKVVLNDNGWF